MNRSRPVTGPASGDHDRYRDNYERVFGGRKHGAQACSGCGVKLRRSEVGLCASCRSCQTER